MISFEKIDHTHLEACGREADFETAIKHITDALDPIDEFRLMSAAAIVFGRNATLPIKAGDRPVIGSVIEAWPQLLPTERVEFVRNWLETVEDKFSK